MWWRRHYAPLPSFPRVTFVRHKGLSCCFVQKMEISLKKGLQTWPRGKRWEGQTDIKAIPAGLEDRRQPQERDRRSRRKWGKLLPVKIAFTPTRAIAVSPSTPPASFRIPHVRVPSFTDNCDCPKMSRRHLERNKQFPRVNIRSDCCEKPWDFTCTNTAIVTNEKTYVQNIHSIMITSVNFLPPTQCPFSLLDPL